MRKLRHSIKWVKVIMMMAILFCVFLCPHDADALSGDLTVCEQGTEHSDLCDCQDRSHHHECELDSSHSHEFRDDTASTIIFNFEHINWAYIAQLFEEPLKPFVYSDMMVRFSSHSFAVRHLDTIILRV